MQNFKTLKQDASGGSLQGYFYATRRKIESIFGDPTFSCENDKWEKVTVEWSIEFEDGTVATIYDWKRYEEGTPGMDEEYEWHIGGTGSHAAELISETVNSAIFDFDMDSPPSFRKKVHG